MEEESEKAYRWEGDYEKTWEALKEDESGSLQSSIQLEIDKAKKRRLLKRQTTIRLGMMRHMLVVIDLSQAMTDQDLKPNRALVVLKLMQRFVEDFFDQNPIGQLGFISTKAKRAQIMSDISGTSQNHLKVFDQVSNEIIKTNAKGCTGEPSLQNALELCEKSLKHMPSHTSREVVVIMGSLTTCDPGDIYKTISEIKKQKIRCSVIGLSAEVHICKYLTKETGGSYGVILDHSHFSDLLKDHISPPSDITTESSLIKMGFPPHVPLSKTEKIALCMSKKQLGVGGYYCPQCNSKYSELPVQCVVCSLTLISAPHLARSYHHLFPLPEYIEVNQNEEFNLSNSCFSCLSTFSQNADSKFYQCSKCSFIFCLDCNLFIHETLHCCPGCVNCRCDMSIHN